MNENPLLELHLEAKYLPGEGSALYELGPLDIVIRRGELLELELDDPVQVEALERILLAHDFDWLGLYLHRGRRVRWENRHELRKTIEIDDPVHCWQCDERPVMKADHLHRIMPSIVVTDDRGDDRARSRLRLGCGLLVLTCSTQRTQAGSGGTPVATRRT